MHHSVGLLVYFTVLLLALLFAWQAFDRSSLAASTLFAFTSRGDVGDVCHAWQLLPRYGIFAADQDLVTALYYAMITMTTVGYGGGDL
jgi:voltage-gated potassium channel